MNIYIGNLPYRISEDEIKSAFSNHGNVESVVIIKDKQTGRSKGFGFVQMPDNNHVKVAMTEMGCKELGGRNIRANAGSKKD